MVWTTYAEGITDALKATNHPDGSPRHVIKNHMLPNLPENKSFGNDLLQSALRQMRTNGDITMTIIRHQKWYKLSPTKKAASLEDAVAATAARANTKQAEATKQKAVAAKEEVEAAETKKDAEAEAKTDAVEAEDERALAEFEVFLLNSSAWLEDKNEVEQMEEDEGRVVDDYGIDDTLEELERKFLHETREVAAAIPVSELSRAKMKTINPVFGDFNRNTTPKHQPMYNFRGCAPTEGAIAENNKQQTTTIERAHETKAARKLLKMEYKNKNNTHPAKAKEKRPPPERGKILARKRGCRPKWPQSRYHQSRH